MNPITKQWYFVLCKDGQWHAGMVDKVDLVAKTVTISNNAPAAGGQHQTLTMTLNEVENWLANPSMQERL